MVADTREDFILGQLIKANKTLAAIARIEWHRRGEVVFGLGTLDCMEWCRRGESDGELDSLVVAIPQGYEDVPGYLLRAARLELRQALEGKRLSLAHMADYIESAGEDGPAWHKLPVWRDALRAAEEHLAVMKRFEVLEGDVEGD